VGAKEAGARPEGGRGALGGLAGMASEAVMSAAERLARPSGNGTRSPRPAEESGGLLGEVAASVVGTIAPAVIERVDIEAIVERVDIDRVLARVDVNRVLARVDVEALLDRVDPNPLIEKIDVDRVVERVDMGPVAREAIEGLDLGEIIRDSTVGLGGEVVHDVRLQAMRADRAVERAVDGLLGREPRGAVIPAPGRAPSRAGIVSRVIATLIDALVVVLAGLVLLLVAASVRLFWTGDLDLGFEGAQATRVGVLALLLVYLTYGWGLDGRTAGKLAMGLQVLDEGGTDLSFRRALARAVLAMVFPIGLLWAAVGERSASVQDLVLRTVVVHDWGRRQAPERPARRGEASQRGIAR
jgi:uncharacterized RDD family membrane protein YckC